jgi:hypothetical protein
VDASAVATIWSGVLDGETVRADDDFFFTLGGNSLLAAAVVTTMALRSGLPLELQDLYLAPTPREFGQYLTQLESRMAQLRAQVPDGADWDLAVFVTALAELGGAVAQTFLPAESTLLYHPAAGPGPAGASSGLSLLRQIRGRGACTADRDEGSGHLIRRDGATLRVAAERTPEGVTIHFHEV